MFRWIKDRIEVTRLTRERADRLASENKMLRDLAHARQQEVDRLNAVLDRVQAVVCSWKK